MVKRWLIILACVLFAFTFVGQDPNFIFIFCDDLMDLDSPYAQSLDIQTPNIDILKSQGVTFNNAHSNSTICSPSRASVFLGKYPHNTGYYGYNMGENSWHMNPILDTCTSVFKHLKNNGYSVYGSGKLFHGISYEIKQENFTEFVLFPSGPFAWDGISYNDGGKKIMKPHPDNPELLNSHFDGVYTLSDIPVFTDTSGWFQNDNPFLYVNDSVRDLLADELTLEYAQEILSSEQNDPFFIGVGFRKPHTPYFLPQKYFDLYPIEDIEIPETLSNEIDGIALANYHNRNFVKNNNQDFEGLMVMSEDSLDTEWWVKKHIQGYKASISFLDEMVGGVLDALIESDYSENTYVILTSDHGFTLGQKHTLNKNNLWSPAIDIPLIISGPNIPHDQSCNTPVSLIDLYPTILSLANLPSPPNEIDGYSMKDLIESPGAGTWDGPDFAISAVSSDEYIANGKIAKKEHQHFALSNAAHRYIRLSSGEEELYDIVLDPEEHFNVASLETNLSTKIELRNSLENVIGFESQTISKGSLKYNNFEQNLNGWKLSNKADTGFVRTIQNATTPEGNYHLKVETIPYLYADYKFNLSNSNLHLIQGNQYRFSFDGKTSTYGNKVKFVLMRKNGFETYGKVGSAAIPLDTIWQHHDFTFTYPGYSSKTDFNLIMNFLKKNQIYEIDNIQFCNLTTGNCDDSCPIESFEDPATNAYTYLNQSGFQFLWQPPAQSVDCEIQANIASEPLGENESYMIFGSTENPPENLGPFSYTGFFPINEPVIQGEVYRWRVRCGCSEENMSPFTNFNYFSVPMLLQENDFFQKTYTKSLDVYPNPSSGIFYIDLPSSALVEVHDNRGVLVYKGHITNDRLDLSFLSKGLYILTTFSEELVSTKKLIIQ